MAKPRLFGSQRSVYVRAVRLALAEKEVGYDLQDVDLLAGAHKEATHLARHPFGKMPAFEHEGFALYETCAIERYIDEAFQGPRLQPGDPRGRALMMQIISIIDSYAFPAMIHGIVIPRLSAARSGKKLDEAAIETAVPEAGRALAAIEDLFVGEFLAAKTLSLADLHFAPICHYFQATPEGESLLSGTPKISLWWSTVSRRQSLVDTEPQDNVSS